MKIDSSAFQVAFQRRLQTALEQLGTPPSGEAAPVDSLAGSVAAEAASSVTDLQKAAAAGPSGLRSGLALEQQVLALNAAVGAATAPVLAGLAALVGRELFGSAEEQAEGAASLDSFATYRVTPEAEPAKLALVAETWNRVATVTSSPFAGPNLVSLFLTVAEANANQMFIGSQALDGELNDPSVLTFTMAHEEGHRQHRDSAGNKGLEALVEVAKEFSAPAERATFLALAEGRQENERQADRFGAEVAARLDCDPKPILRFLLDAEGDLQHPDGLYRAQAVRDRMAELGKPTDAATWQALLAETRRPLSAH